MKHICYKHDHVEKKEVGILIFVREIKHFWCTFLQVSQACYVFLNQRRISCYTSIRQIANILTCFSCRVINQYLFICDLFGIYLLESFWREEGDWNKNHYLRFYDLISYNDLIFDNVKLSSHSAPCCDRTVNCVDCMWSSIQGAIL